MKKGVLKNFTKFTGKHLCQGLFLTELQVSGLQLYLKKEALTQVFSCKLCEIFKNTFIHRTPPVAASINTEKWGHVLSLKEKLTDNIRIILPSRKLLRITALRRLNLKVTRYNR